MPQLLPSTAGRCLRPLTPELGNIGSWAGRVTERAAVGCRWLVLIAAFLPGAALASELGDRLQPLLEGHRGYAALAVRHLGTGESFFFRADEPMPTASLIKLPVMVEVYRQVDAGQVSLSDELVLAAADQVPGSGILTPHFSVGAKLSLRDAVRLMIVYSDNSATNLVLDRIGLGATARQMERLGLPNTKIHAKVFRRDTSLYPERSAEYGLGSTTAREMVQLLELLQQRKLVSAAASDEMLEHLAHCADKTKIARDLPAEIEVAHKGGATSRVRTDAGIVSGPSGPIAICILTRENRDRSYEDDNQAHRLCGAVARAAFDYFNPVPDTPAPFRSRLRQGDSGQLVEDLQRTLNLRLSPSPELAVDGDFGPQTKAAVVRFQGDRDLEVTGDVTDETWNALGLLETADAEVRSPEEVHSQELAVEAMDALEGRPFVTCKAWAASDGSSGELLWSENAGQRLDIASTTKIMTAFVVLQYAQQHPDVLDEQLIFSSRADQTIGSTAAVRAGEQLSVHETLYGLLLPSGNDASIALAEHFGKRLAEGGENYGDDDESSAPDPVDLFVQQMNRVAAELGMTNTTYKNTHGLTAAGHQSTAADLLRLVFAAWQLDRFRDYVRTRQRGCELIGPGGYRRNIVWKNTNQLLKIAGYDGIKTGTTSAAGACLVSTATRDGQRRFLVVLGSASSAARYADSRNLYRWIWKQ